MCVCVSLIEQTSYIYIYILNIFKKLSEYYNWFYLLILLFLNKIFLKRMNLSSPSGDYELIYATHKPKAHRINAPKWIKFLVSAISATVLALVISRAKQDQLLEVLKQNQELLLNQTKHQLTTPLSFYITTPLSALLVLVFSVINKPSNCKYIGCPRLVSCWSKTNRFHASLVYGLIAAHIFQLFESPARNQNGFYKLFVQITQILLIGLSNPSNLMSH